MNKNILSIPRGLRLAMCGVWEKARGQRTPGEVPEQQSGEAPEAVESAALTPTSAMVDYRDLDFDVEFSLGLDHSEGGEDGNHDDVRVADADAIADAAFSLADGHGDEELVPDRVGTVHVDSDRVDTVHDDHVVVDSGIDVTIDRIHVESPDPDPVVAKPAPAKRVPAQAGEPSPTARRREIAEELLATVGRTRPIVARDVAERFGSGVDRSQRESARTALNRLVVSGVAVRLPDGSFIPADGADAGVES